MKSVQIQPFLKLKPVFESLIKMMPEITLHWNISNIQPEQLRQVSPTFLFFASAWLGIQHPPKPLIWGEMLGCVPVFHLHRTSCGWRRIPHTGSGHTAFTQRALSWGNRLRVAKSVTLLIKETFSEMLWSVIRSIDSWWHGEWLSSRFMHSKEKDTQMWMSFLRTHRFWNKMLRNLSWKTEYKGKTLTLHLYFQYVVTSNSLRPHGL